MGLGLCLGWVRCPRNWTKRPHATHRTNAVLRITLIFKLLLGLGLGLGYGGRVVRSDDDDDAAK